MHVRWTTRPISVHCDLYDVLDLRVARQGTIAPSMRGWSKIVIRLTTGVRLLISAPSLGVYHFFVVDSVCLSVCLSDCHKHCFFFCFFFDGIKPFFGHQFSMTKTTKLFFFDFWFRPLTPKIYSKKCAFAGHWVSHSLWVNDILARRGDPVAYRLDGLVCSIYLENALQYVERRRVRWRHCTVHFSATPLTDVITLPGSSCTRVVKSSMSRGNSESSISNRSNRQCRQLPKNHMKGNGR